MFLRTPTLTRTILINEFCVKYIESNSNQQKGGGKGMGEMRG